MAKQTVNIGAVANDGTGDPLRTAFDKVNDNFDEVYGNSFVEEDRIAAGAVTITKIADAAKVTEAEGISSNDNDTTLPTSAAVKDYVDTEISGLIDSAPAALDTLNELAAALGDDANFASTVTTALAGKQATLTSGDITFSLIDPAAIVTEAEGISSNDNDTTIPTSAAVVDYVASQAGSDTTYTVSAADGTYLYEKKIVLTGSDSSTDSVILEAGANLTVSRTGDNIKFDNNSPDQIVTLTNGTGITTSGTYPNFTITNSAPDQTVSLGGGTGISVSGTYPSFTVTNSAPDQTVSLTGSGATSVTGTYPNFTISSTDTNTQLSTEQVQDIVGAMVSGNTENNITVTYNDTTGKLDFVANAGDITGVTAGSGLTGGGTSGTVTISHADTSAQGSVNNSGRTYIQDITLDTYGHVTGITSATETVVDTNTTYSAGSGLDLTGTTFSIETDLRDGINLIGLDTTDYMEFSNNAWCRTVVNSTERLRVDTAGIDVSGRIVADADITAYSDERLKKDVKTIENALEKTEALRGVEYTRIADDSKSIGVIAQELEKVLPELVLEDQEGMKSVNYGQITGLLIEAVKELSAEVKELKKQINV